MFDRSMSKSLNSGAFNNTAYLSFFLIAFSWSRRLQTIRTRHTKTPNAKRARNVYRAISKGVKSSTWTQGIHEDNSILPWGVASRRNSTNSGVTGYTTIRVRLPIGCRFSARFQSATLPKFIISRFSSNHEILVTGFLNPQHNVCLHVAAWVQDTYQIPIIISTHYVYSTESLGSHMLNMLHGYILTRHRNMI